MALVKRNDKKAFWGIPTEGGEATFTRMKGFTELTGSKNPKEYARQYVDENHETTDVIAYSPSMAFAFDELTDDAVLADLVSILNKEMLGTDARREIIQVDFSNPVDGGYAAIKRTFSVIGDAEGGNLEAYTYSGNFKAVGKSIHGVAAIVTPVEGDSDTVETITFTAETKAE